MSKITGKKSTSKKMIKKVVINHNMGLVQEKAFEVKELLAAGIDPVSIKDALKSRKLSINLKTIAAVRKVITKLYGNKKVSTVKSAEIKKALPKKMQTSNVAKQVGSSLTRLGFVNIGNRRNSNWVAA